MLKIFLVRPAPVSLALFSLLLSCHSLEHYFYSDESLELMRQIKKQKAYTYLAYPLPKPGHRENPRKLVRLSYRKRHFDRDSVVFALYGRSTKNYGLLDYDNGGLMQRIDSSACDHGETLLLTLSPVQKGTYSIEAWGCRFQQRFEITIR